MLIYNFIHTIQQALSANATVSSTPPGKMLSYISPFLNLLLLHLSFSTSTQQCKNYPGDPKWPDTATWQALNTTVGGRLSVPTPLGAVCHLSDPSFNNLTCQTLLANWSNTSFVATNPYLTDYNDDTCSPYAVDGTCSATGYPAYVISAVDAEDVQFGVNFARQHGVRLVIKGTGHDFPGRSSGPGSLSIYTHNLRGIEVVMRDLYAMRYGGIASVKIAAGHRFREIYAEAAKHNITIVGGADGDVGIGGWILNGGHSPISSVYGLGADQVLALEVVTADGRLLNVNETSHPDLFWAMRGGGGSTFGVMISVAVKAYPQLSASLMVYSIATSADSDTFWSLLAYFHSKIPAISEAGGGGYHYLTRGLSIGKPEIDVLNGVWFFPRKTIEEMQAILDPVYSPINESDWAVDPLFLTTSNTSFTDAMTSLAGSGSESAGFSGRLGSWLLDEPALTANFTLLKSQLKTAAPSPWNMISHVIAGPGVRNAVASLPGGSNAVLPAWRKTYTHIVLPVVWPTSPQNATIKLGLTKLLRESSVPALKALAPKSGAYINEADPTNPDWKQDYFGSNYDRLLKVKQRCKPCVGWDEWDIQGEDDTLGHEELGVGQRSGKLCRVA